MERRTKQRFGLVMGMTVLLLAAAIGFFRGSSSGDEAEPAATVPPSVTAVDGGATEPATAPRMDVAFVVDATGSMHDEIEVIKEEIRQVAEEITAGHPRPEVRFALVLYRDKTDEVVVESTELTHDVGLVYRRLARMKAKGGGDRREHVLGGLAAALNLDWQMGSEVSRSIYLVGDAPAHTDYPRGPKMDAVVAEARRRGIPIESIGCSGIEGASGEAQFASLSGATSGRYRSLTYHTVVDLEGGEKRSVLYRNGEFYAADEVLAEEKWRRRPAELVESGALKPATERVAAEARRAEERSNNLDRVIQQNLKARMRGEGVAY